MHYPEPFRSLRLRLTRPSAAGARVARLVVLSLVVGLTACVDNPLPVAPPEIAASPNVAMNTTWPQVSAGAAHSCALTADGSMTCWGWNAYGQTSVPPGTWSQMSAGYTHTCAVRTDGTLACWGFNQFGQATPPPGTFTQVTAGSSHSCALTPNRDVTCWGYNWDGQVAGTPSTTPTTFTHTGPFAMVGVGGYETCALRLDGAVSCWGRKQVVDPPPDTEKFVQLESDIYQTCGVRVDGSVGCWGSIADVAVVPEGTFTQVSAGFFHACAVQTDGDVTCWGSNGYGAVSGTPTPVVGYPVFFTHTGPFKQVSAGTYHTCAVRGNGSLVCWGAGTSNTGIDPHHGQSAPPTLQVSQAISFTSTPPSPALLGGTYEVSATGGSSGNPVLFSSLTPTVCTAGASAGNASTVVFIAVGTCTVAANQVGDGSHLDAEQVQQTFAVVYHFGASTGEGFAPPVSSTAFNAVRAGQSVPIKFDLGGDQGSDVLALGWPRSMVIACPSAGDPVNAVPETTVTAGASTLSYDASTGLYTYVWKTDRTWAGTCRRFTIRLDDQTEHSATFQFAR